LPRQSLVGDVPNLAARMQVLAAPNTVVISDSTRRLVGGLFELDDLGPRRLKGFPEPLAVWRVAAESRIEGRFEARQTTGLTPLVGREEEIALLLRCWRQARNGEGQVMLLAGEPGIGKSRLVRELRGRLSGESSTSRTWASGGRLERSRSTVRDGSGTQSCRSTNFKTAPACWLRSRASTASSTIGASNPSTSSS
jgi:hypothetical protein